MKNPTLRRAWVRCALRQLTIEVNFTWPKPIDWEREGWLS